jgi:hypothetical protein
LRRYCQEVRITRTSESAAYDVAHDPAVESLLVLLQPSAVGLLLLLLDDALPQHGALTSG